MTAKWQKKNRPNCAPPLGIPAALLCVALLFFAFFSPLALAAVAGQEGTGTEPPTASPQPEETAQTPTPGQEADPQQNPEDEPEEEEQLFQPDYTVQAQAAYMVNAETGVVVYEKNADVPLTSASLVKMMTCILTVEYAENLDEETVLAERWVFNQLYGLNASHADIRYGETLTLRELLYAMILPSGNEAALMAANYISGGYMPNFLYMMNEKARALGCTGTYFADPNGLSEDNRITAHDACLILQEFMSHPELAEIAAQANYQMAAHNHSAPYYISSTNRFLFTSDPYAKAYPTVAAAMLGGKTGGLGEWQSFACVAEKDNQTFYCVVLHSPYAADTVRAAMENPDGQAYRPALVEAAELLTWALTSLEVRPTIDTRQPVHELPVRYSTERDAVRLLPLEDLRTLLPKDKGESAITMVFDVPEYLEAPVEQGQVVGTVTLYLAGVELGTTQLVTQQAVARSEGKYQLSLIAGFFRSTFLKTYLLLIILVVLLYAAFIVFYNSRRKKKRQKKG